MRFNLVGAFIGQRGTGKTLFATGSRYAARQEDKALNIPGIFDSALQSQKKVLIVDTLDHPAYRAVPLLKQSEVKTFTSGLKRTFHEPDDILLFVDLINRSPNFNNTLVIFEDAGKYTEKTLPRPFKRLIIDSKQRNIDIVFMYHCFIDTPSNLFTKIDFIQLFKTEDSPECRKHNIRLYEKVQTVYEQVKADPNRFCGKFIDTRTN